MGAPEWTNTFDTDHESIRNYRGYQIVCGQLPDRAPSGSIVGGVRHVWRDGIFWIDCTGEDMPAVEKRVDRLIASLAAKKANASRTPEQRSAAAKKAHATIRRNRQADGASRAE